MKADPSQLAAVQADYKQAAVAQKPPSSQHTGVSWHKTKQAWMACICIGGKQQHLGYYAKEDDAAAAY